MTGLAAGTLLAMTLVGCASAPQHIVSNERAQSGDLAWIDRLTYGVSARTEADYRQRGRSAYLAWQLSGASDALPPAVAQQLATLEVSRLDAAAELLGVAAEYRRINTLPDGPDREQARKTLNERGNRLGYEAQRRELLRAIYSPAQLKEQMVGFWLNHFSVFQYKANVRWVLGDFAENAVRPNALGSFRELVLATLEHPAMLQYLDNAQNAVGHVNENYARELMELHTLGVAGGYTQADVQALARILTGVGVVTSDTPPKLKKEWQPLYVRRGGFEFNPARHDFGDKLFLGHRIAGSGFAEVEQAVDLLTQSEACAKFVSTQLAHYFVSDAPPPGLIDHLARRFSATHGDLAAVLKALFEDPAFPASLGHKFKDPQHFVVSALRLAYDERPIQNFHPVLGWLGGLGQAPFGRQTPDGYPLDESGWASSGQMSRRFEIARAIGSGPAGLFDPEDGSAATTRGFPRLATALYFTRIEPALSPRTRAALDATASQLEWNTVLLASPEFNYR
jgi:uncharacterized protein (DUF1800 family)